MLVLVRAASTARDRAIRSPESTVRRGCDSIILMPRFRLGLVIGFGVGYYLGTKAGQERYEQLRALVARTPLSKVQAACELGLERFRDHAPAPGEAVLPPSPN